MTVVNAVSDDTALTLTIVARFDAEPDLVWKLWEDPRLLERWWGPPTFPATFVRHEFVAGGQSRYFMTGPAGETPRGWWRIDFIDKPRRLEFANGLAGDDGEPLPGTQPTSASASFEAVEGGTSMTVTTRFADAEQMKMMLDRGMQEGMALAIGQIDGLLLEV